MMRDVEEEIRDKRVNQRIFMKIIASQRVSLLYSVNNTRLILVQSIDRSLEENLSTSSLFESIEQEERENEAQEQKKTES